MSDPLMESAKTRLQQSSTDPTKWIRSLNVKQYRQWRMRPFDKEGNIDSEKQNQQDAALFVVTLCDEEGNLKYQQADIEKLCHVDAGIAERLMREIQDHLGVGEQEDIEETVKNSEETPNVSLRTA